MASENETASYCWQPSNSGDGYSWGGGHFVKIGERLLFIGEDFPASVLAKEIVRRWNAAREVKDGE